MYESTLTNIFISKDLRVPLSSTEKTFSNEKDLNIWTACSFLYKLITLIQKILYTARSRCWNFVHTVKTGHKWGESFLLNTQTGKGSAHSCFRDGHQSLFWLSNDMLLLKQEGKKNTTITPLSLNMSSVLLETKSRSCSQQVSSASCCRRPAGMVFVFWSSPQQVRYHKTLKALVYDQTWHTLKAQVHNLQSQRPVSLVASPGPWQIRNKLV